MSIREKLALGKPVTLTKLEAASLLSTLNQADADVELCHKQIALERRNWGLEREQIQREREGEQAQRAELHGVVSRQEAAIRDLEEKLAKSRAVEKELRAVLADARESVGRMSRLYGRK